MSGRFISHPNTATLHRGSREDGAKCGQPSDSWADIDADNPLDAVYYYDTKACTKCFNHAAGLRRVQLKEHSAYKIHDSLSDITAKLPWSLTPDTDRSVGDA